MSNPQNNELTPTKFKSPKKRAAEPLTTACKKRPTKHTWTTPERHIVRKTFPKYIISDPFIYLWKIFFGYIIFKIQYILSVINSRTI